MKQRKPTRLKDYDYSKGGGYFVTICTKNRINRFGEIVNGEMVLNSGGKIASEMLNGLIRLFHNVVIDQYIVMPNHVHCIINIIENLPVGNASERMITQPAQSLTERLTPNETIYSEMRSSVDTPNDRSKMLLSKVLQVYKSGVTKRIKKIEKLAHP
jgi:REP element-mobilizing transposase RayT